MISTKTKFGGAQRQAGAQQQRETVDGTGQGADVDASEALQSTVA